MSAEVGRLLGLSFGVVKRRWYRKRVPHGVFRPANPVGRVVVSGLGAGGVGGIGKATPDYFFGPFVHELARNRIETKFAFSPRELKDSIRDDLETELIHIYNEINGEYGAVEAFDNAHPELLIFNRSATGAIAGNKRRTHERLRSFGLPVPRLAEEIADGATIFSNAVAASGAEVMLIDRPQRLDKHRHNVEFIDTRRDVGGQGFHTTVRLLAVSGTLLAAYVRARPVEEGSPSVHASDTPLDPDLIRALHAMLVTPRMSELADLAWRAGEALGPGFYAHDLVTCARTGTILFVESGIKMDDMAYRDHCWPVAVSLPEYAMMFSPEQPANSARAFMNECRRLGFFLSAPIDSKPSA